MRKIPTLFVRDENDRRFVTEQVALNCEWVIDGEGVATRKWDGTCVRINPDGTVWARREVKAGKQPPAHFEVVQHDTNTGKTVGWEPADQSSFAKFIAEARSGDEQPGTYELVGPKINSNPDGFSAHTLVPHGELTVSVPDRSFDGIRAAVLASAPAEGLVFWREQGNPDAEMVKIKLRDFRP